MQLLVVFISIVLAGCVCDAREACTAEDKNKCLERFNKMRTEGHSAVSYCRGARTTYTCLRDWSATCGENVDKELNSLIGISSPMGCDVAKKDKVESVSDLQTQCTLKVRKKCRELLWIEVAKNKNYNPETMCRGTRATYTCLRDWGTKCGKIGIDKRLEEAMRKSVPGCILDEDKNDKVSTSGHETDKSSCVPTYNCLQPMSKQSILKIAMDDLCENLQDALKCFKNLPPENTCRSNSGKLNMKSLLNSLTGIGCPRTYANGSLDVTPAERKCATRFLKCIRPLEERLNEGAVQCRVKYDVRWCLKTLARSAEPCLDNGEIEAYLFLRMRGKSCYNKSYRDDDPGACRPGMFKCNDGPCIRSNLRCNEEYDCIDGEDERNCENTTSPVVANEEGEETKCTDKCLRSLLTEIDSRRTYEEGFCDILKDAYNCINNLAVSRVCITVKEMLYLHSNFREVNKMVGYRCRLVDNDAITDCKDWCWKPLKVELRSGRTKLDGFCEIMQNAYKCLKNMADAEVCVTKEEMRVENSIFKQINEKEGNRCSLDIDDYGEDETKLLRSCVHQNQDHLLECARETTVDVFTSPVGEENSATSLKCEMLDKLFGCLYMRTVEGCGRKMANRLTKIVKSKLPDEMLARCGLTKQSARQNARLNITDNLTVAG